MFLRKESGSLEQGSRFLGRHFQEERHIWGEYCRYFNSGTTDETVTDDFVWEYVSFRQLWRECLGGSLSQEMCSTAYSQHTTPSQMFQSFSWEKHLLFVLVSHHPWRNKCHSCWCHLNNRNYKIRNKHLSCLLEYRFCRSLSSWGSLLRDFLNKSVKSNAVKVKKVWQQLKPE